MARCHVIGEQMSGESFIDLDAFLGELVSKHETFCTARNAKAPTLPYVPYVAKVPANDPLLIVHCTLLFTRHTYYLLLVVCCLLFTIG